MQWGLGGALALTLTIWAFGPPFIDLMTTSPEVRERHYLLWLTLAPVIGFAAWVYGGVIGAMLTGVCCAPC
jgi:Na+-driven multidrug efflux pump